MKASLATLAAQEGLQEADPGFYSRILAAQLEVTKMEEQMTAKGNNVHARRHRKSSASRIGKHLP